VYDSNDKNVVTMVDTHSERSVFLTFDDGPSRHLPEILNVLKKENVPAAFFWQSRLLYPARPWNRVLADGHQIGTHSTKHVNLTKLSYAEQYQDLSHSVTRIENIIGKKVTLFRPPFGQYNSDTIKAANELNLVPVIWRVSSMDWELKKDPDKIIKNVVAHLEDGAIILLHELEQTLAILPDLIREIKVRGYQLGSL
jgi:peptidoglycan/xylan/chitin deacetylase (PgdA/CDA1 family)